MGIVGTDRVQPIGAAFPHPGGELRIRFGRPLTFPDAAEVGNNVARLRALTDEIMCGIAELTGQETVSRYAARER